MNHLEKVLEERLKSIDISHLFAQSLEHGVSYNEYNNESKWKLFEPTKFVYSFFAFNMLYEVDWEKSLNKTFIWDARAHKYTSDKIVLLLDFIYKNHLGIPFEDYLKKYDKNLSITERANEIKIDKVIERIDKNNLLDKQDSYLNNYINVIRNIGNNKIKKEDHYKLLIFCYNVRNNVFHGLKKASEMRKSGQRKRLLDYSHIIMATIEMFFDIVNKKHGYNRAVNDELIENAGFFTY